jgi:hypothetical protein
VPPVTGSRVVQSSSSAALQPAGQQPSPGTQDTMSLNSHRALQLAALPVRVSTVHRSLSSQLLGQVEVGSQVSLASMVPLPQVVEQSMSRVASQPAGQQPSPS